MRFNTVFDSKIKEVFVVEKSQQVTKIMPVFHQVDNGGMQYTLIIQ